MKWSNRLLASSTALLLSTVLQAHEGHGTPGSFGHDLQHQLWTFGGIVLLGALLLSGERIVALLIARRAARRRHREQSDD